MNTFISLSNWTGVLRAKRSAAEEVSTRNRLERSAKSAGETAEESADSFRSGTLQSSATQFGVPRRQDSKPLQDRTGKRHKRPEKIKEDRSRSESACKRDPPNKIMCARFMRLITRSPLLRIPLEGINSHTVGHQRPLHNADLMAGVAEIPAISQVESRDCRLRWPAICIGSLDIVHNQESLCDKKAFHLDGCLHSPGIGCL